MKVLAKKLEVIEDGRVVLSLREASESLV